MKASTVFTFHHIMNCFFPLTYSIMLCNKFNIMWRVDPLLGNDHETNN
jgi:hypothetical protein